MHGDTRLSTAKILNAINYGTVSQEETVRRLEELVRLELEKGGEESDVELITQAEDLLQEMLAKDAQPIESREAETKAAVLRRIAVEKKRQHIRKAALKVASVAAAFMVLLIGDGILNRGWFKKYSTPDGQQYVVQWQEINPGIISEGVADNEPRTGELTTTNLDEAIKFLGFEPDLPTWMPEGWKPAGYDVVILADEKRFRVQYTNSNTNTKFVYSQIVYTQIEEAYASFEQNSNGQSFEIGKIKIYQSVNTDKKRYNWTVDNSVFSLAGDVDYDTVYQIICSIIKSKGR